MRLRSSSVVEAAAPSRARSSKVMQHSVMIHITGQQPLRWYEELHPLAQKSAQTLATSSWKVLVPVAETAGAVVAPAARAPVAAARAPVGAPGGRMSAAAPASAAGAALQAGQRPWMVHVLIGDGVPTNEAVATVLLCRTTCHT